MPKNDFLEVLVLLHETSFPQRTFLLNHCDSLTTKVPILRAWSLRPSILDFFQRIVWLTWDSSKYLHGTFLVQNVTFDSICSILQFPPRRVLLSSKSEILKRLHWLHETIQKARKNLAIQFAQNNANDNCANFTKKAFDIEFCVKWRKWFCTQHEQIEPKVRNSSSSTCAFFLHFGRQLKIDSRSTRYPLCLRFWFKVRKSFVCYKSISVFKFQKDAHFVLNWVKVRKSFVCYQINFSLQVSERCAFRVQFKNDSRSTRYAFSLRFWVKVRKSFVCYQINLSFKLAIQVSEGTHFTFSFRSMLQRPTNGSQNDNYKNVWLKLAKN